MASTLDQPGALFAPFAYSGDKNSIPTTATGTQAASLEEGFPAITSTPISEGGIPPQRTDFNGLGYLLSSQYYYLQNGGRFTFNQEVSDAIGGYPQGAILQYTDGTTSYQVMSLINNNTYNFVNNPSYINDTYWSKVFVVSPTDWVTTNTSQTITGTKIFAGNGSVSYIKNTSVTYNTAPASRYYTNMVFVDKNDAQMGVVGILRDTNNSTTIQLNARGANGDWSGQALRLTVASNGTVTANAPDPTDTTSTSSKQIATVGWVNTVGNNVVHRTSNENIAGYKNFTGHDLYLSRQDVVKGTIPTDENKYITYYFNDKNGLNYATNGLGDIQLAYRTTGVMSVSLNVVKPEANSTDVASLGVYYPASGNPYATAPASDVNGSIVTSIAKSKASRGYFKLGNGMIIQWGWWSTGNTVDTVTFPIPFTAIPKVIGQINYNSTSGQSGITEKSTTSFKVYHASGISGDYIAIGY